MMLRKSTFREIKTSLARYLAIFAIVALGVGFFSGLKVCKQAMVETADAYLLEHNAFDYQILSSYGIDDKSVKLAEAEPGVAAAEASKQIDVIVKAGKEDRILKCISIPDTINTVALAEGRLPESDDECVIDDYLLKGGSFKIGEVIELSDGNEKDTLKNFKKKKFTIVGRVSTPLYLDYQRGSTELGNGELDTFFYVNESVFDTDYYTNLYVKLEGRKNAFSSAYNKQLRSSKKGMEKLAENITSARRETARKDAQKELDEKKQEYEDSLAEFNSKKDETNSKLAKAERDLNSGASTISEKRSELKKKLKTTKSQKAGLEEDLKSVNDNIKLLEQAGQTESEQYLTLIATRKQLKTGISKCSSGIKQIEDGLDELDSKEKEISKGRSELKSNKSKAETEFADAQKELDDAKAKLDEAQEEIDEMETGNSYALSIRDNAGYSSFESNSEIVSNIAKIFPVFFFLVAALVCMTTMTRMIDEQRTQIGILKALGYSNGAILGKYVFYSGSAALLGSLTGFFVGCKVFPMVIWHAYTMMYDFSDTVGFVFDWKLLIISVAAAMLCSVGATYSSISADFKVVPAALIRPKTPKAGKRILLERIKPLWSRIGFLYKVSLRNIFRYKKRFFMMVLGVSGCTALLIAGIGINTSISKVAEYQFSEISLYDYQLIFSKNMSDKDQKAFEEYAEKKTDGRQGDILFLHQGSVDASANGKKVEATCIASDSSDFEKYEDLHYGDKDVKYPGDGEVVVVRKVQKELKLEIGDKITLKDGYREMTATVAGISDNYVGANIYMTEASYQAGFGKKASVKAAYVKLKDGLEDKEIRQIATKCGKYEDASAVVLNLDTLEVVADMMESLNAVVYVVILCAGLLAFIVLYNLTNINITERIREIATIKVLGFNRRETSQYVFRENLFLTGIAALVGIPMGKWLLDFVIDNIVVSMIYFQPRINNVDYALAVAATFVFAFIVNLAMSKRLRDVSMTESLKSIE